MLRRVEVRQFHCWLRFAPGAVTQRAQLDEAAATLATSQLQKFLKRQPRSPAS